MSNWGWPQWVMLVLLIAGLVRRIIDGVMDGQKTHEQLLLDAATRKADWQFNIGISTTAFLFELFILAKSNQFTVDGGRITTTATGEIKFDYEYYYKVVFADSLTVSQKFYDLYKVSLQLEVVQ